MKGLRFKFLSGLVEIDLLLSEFKDNGEIKNDGIAHSLSAKIAAAQHHLNSGHTEQAAKHLRDLQKTLKTYAANGSISNRTAGILDQNIEYMLENGMK
jgi:hypothetical protein